MRPGGFAREDPPGEQALVLDGRFSAVASGWRSIAGGVAALPWMRLHLVKEPVRTQMVTGPRAGPGENRASHRSRHRRRPGWHWRRLGGAAKGPDVRHRNACLHWCRLQGSNPRPPDYKSGALPAELSRLSGRKIGVSPPPRKPMLDRRQPLPATGRRPRSDGTSRARSVSRKCPAPLPAAYRRGPGLRPPPCR